jgi:cytochrome c2
MSRFLRILGLAEITCAISAQTTTGDASRGEQLLCGRGCINCHELHGQGGNTAPNLAKRTSRNYTQAYVAGEMWNHALAKSPELASSPLTNGEAVDLFAYFASRRFFESLGDALRGRRVFVAKHCNACHGIAGPGSAQAPAVVKWRSLRDPIAFAQELWNRSPGMLRESTRKGLPHPRLTAPEVNDLLVYLENLPAVRGREPQFRLASADTGRVVFLTKGCAGCHPGGRRRESGASRASMASISAALWNHAFANENNHPVLSYDEISALVGYAWAREGQGNVRRGRRIFASKKCTACHEDAAAGSDGSKIALSGRRELGPVSILTALGSHGPGVKAEMSRKGIAWPHFAGSEMSDLAAYLEIRKGALPEESTQSTAVGLGRLARINDYR